MMRRSLFQRNDLHYKNKEVMITYNAEGIAMPKIKKRLTSKWIKAVAASHGRKVGEVG